LLSMMKTTALTTLAVIIASTEAQFNPLEHLGGNSPWFKGPNVFDISPDAPEGCSVDQAAFSSRHGSRYPDPGAYNGWLTLSAKVRLASKSNDPKD
jgi:acid phosphatase